MFFRLLADLVLALHLLFILFVVFGGLLLFRWERIILLHLPAVFWGFFIEISGRICPLTPLENRLRTAAGEAGYPGGFIEHYLLAAVYPEGLTRHIQFYLAAAVVLINLLFYAIFLYRRKRV